MSAPPGDSSGRGRRESSQGRDVVDLSSENHYHYVIDLTNDSNEWQSLPRGSASPQVYYRVEERVRRPEQPIRRPEQPIRRPEQPIRSQTERGFGRPPVREDRFRGRDEDDSDDDIEILSVNRINNRPTPLNTYRPTPSNTYRPTPSDTYRPTPSDNYRPTPSDTYRPTPSDNYRPTPSDTYRPSNQTRSSSYDADYFDESRNHGDDLEITGIRRAPSAPQGHIDTPMGHFPFTSGPRFQSHGNEAPHSNDNPYPSRNVRRRIGNIPVPTNPRGTRSLPPRNNLGHRTQPPSQRGRQHPPRNSVHARSHMPIPGGEGRPRGPPPPSNRGNGGRNQQHRPPRGPRRGSSFAQETFPDFVNRINFHIRFSDSAPHFIFHNMFGGGGDVPPDVLENNIMQRIEEDNNRAADVRRERESNYNRKSMVEKQKLAEMENAKGTHTNKIDPSDDLVCELCGVTLGEGVPDSFKGDPKYDLNFAKYADQYQTQAPWFCVNPFTTADHDLSKRIFASKCGHTFCGRCVKNIAGRPTRKPKDAPSGFTIKNPSIYAPTKCPAKDCGKRFVSKAFTEVFF
ncbi:hypothetical protein I9W82_000421 [Candida metapsilosis]|uniref:RING-type domain-containing protein n=1 Tax=Candida metapsilosis TaxID=273372 RepID=A0A8H7ZJH2_9ASCO|nr:hypothetical protein I9W82_000421 [Candida metapsilosis]